MSESLFWSDQLADKTVEEFPDKDVYVCASGISPSGTVHAGNFREIITTDFVVKSLKNKGEDVKFIYSWDDFDRFRKVPANVPNEFEKYIGLPLTKVPDPEGEHESYAEHFEKKLEQELEGLQMDIEFIRQSEKFEKAEYAELIKKGLQHRKEIKKILDKYRKEPLEAPYYPLRVYCTKCDKDFTDIKDWDREYTITYYCNECDEEKQLNFKEEGKVKQPWRIDWPMRWKYEGVHFEPAGKEHSAAGGSRDTGNELAQKIYDKKPPVHQMYEFVTKDGAKISSSSGEDTFTLTDLKEAYTPEMIRFLFSETKPNKAFEIPFDDDIFQIYEKFDKIESAYFNPEKMENERKRKHWKRVYELAMVEIPQEQPTRAPFKHLSFVAQTVPEGEWSTKGFDSLKRTGHIEELNSEDRKALLQRMKCAKTWARKHADEEYRYQINYNAEGEFSEEELEAFELLKTKIEKGYEDQDDFDSKIFNAKKESELGTGAFFTACYNLLLGRDQGPRLSRLIISIGDKKAIQIFDKALE